MCGGGGGDRGGGGGGGEEDYVIFVILILTASSGDACCLLVQYVLKSFHFLFLRIIYVMMYARHECGYTVIIRAF